MKVVWVVATVVAVVVLAPIVAVTAATITGQARPR